MTGDGYNFARLKEKILTMSRAQVWDKAVKEWSLTGVFHAGPGAAYTCECGHYPIVELCEIRNFYTRKTTTVGNVCVERFLRQRSDLIFNGVRKVRKEIEKPLSKKAIEFFYFREVLNDWELDFYMDTRLTRHLTDKQLQTRIKINRKVLAAMVMRLK